jgi:membrane glycosyltransferase
LSSAIALAVNDASGGMPPPAPLLMPVQDLKYSPRRTHRRRFRPAVFIARLILLGVTLSITAYGVYQMLDAVRFSSMTLLQGLMILFFAVTLNWIGFAAGAALAGLTKFSDPRPPANLSTDGVRTALVMPAYNEDPIVITAALQAMAEQLAQSAAKEIFEIVILSDSTDADAWIRESIAVDQLRARVHNMPVWYRRRWHNVARKAGNIEDFVERWGGRFDYMVVLDADSLIDADTLVALVRRMHADPALGILQTVPTLIGAMTLFGRLQQFAARVYGPIIARGLSAWSGDDGNYWGHNAIIRVQAFAACCGLPQLPGRKPFGGFIMSHDFVEAALMRRAGWKVRLNIDLGGSYEECPPTLADLAVRDRRWAQGNLQHTKVIDAAGLSLASRLHLAVGIMSYLSSPVWLVLLCVGFALALQAHLIRPEYFTHDFQLFPTWPLFDARLMLSLFMFSMLVLFVPKLMGVLRAIVNGPIRRAPYGIIGLTLSIAIELALSVLYAPVLMLTQSQHVFEIIVGRDSGWNAQRRRAGDTDWGDAWGAYGKLVLIGIFTAVIAWFLSPPLLAWLSPALLGLILAVPLARASGSVAIGRALGRLGLLRTPEEAQVPPLVARKLELIAAASPMPRDGLHFLARNREARLTHIHSNLAPPTEARGQPDPNGLTAEQKLQDAQSLEEALDWLKPSERVHVAGNPQLLARLAALPDHLPRPTL